MDNCTYGVKEPLENSTHHIESKVQKHSILLISKFQEEVSQLCFLEVEPFTLGDQMMLDSSVMVILSPDKHLRESSI